MELKVRNVDLAGLPQCRNLDRVQSILNAATRLTAGARKYDHVTSLLQDLHWLWVNLSATSCAFWFSEAFTVQHHVTWRIHEGGGGGGGHRPPPPALELVTH